MMYINSQCLQILIVQFHCCVWQQLLSIQLLTTNPLTHVMSPFCARQNACWLYKYISSLNSFHLTNPTLWPSVFIKPIMTEREREVTFKLKELSNKCVIILERIPREVNLSKSVLWGKNALTYVTHYLSFTNQLKIPGWETADVVFRIKGPNIINICSVCTVH